MPIDPVGTLDKLIREDSAGLVRQSVVFDPLIKGSAWKELENIAKKGIELRIEILLLPDKSVDEMVQKEYIKGVIYGIKWLLNIPAYTMELGNQLRVKEQEELDASRRPSGTRSDDDTSGVRDPTDDERSELDLGPNATVTETE